MKADAAPTILPTTVAAAKRESTDGTLFGRTRYKFWALTAILLLAFWSMFTGTVTLKWSAGNLNPLSDDLDSQILDDLDILVYLTESPELVVFDFPVGGDAGSGGAREGGETYVGCVHA
ncbi:hypothetical protein L1049_026279 [Liquidambar formosana]|uniref:Uncharacterized protein n=1 Tax=Liquidambar formosana TaxID=63359 RepID=A0AAP0NEJ3_LIQFO